MSSAPSAQATSARPASGGWSSALRGFFRYHGLLAPAVRLLRSQPIHVKIAIVSSAFVAATVLLSVGYVAQARDAEARIDREVAAIAHLRALTPLRAALLAERQAVADRSAASVAPGSRAGDPALLQSLADRRAQDASADEAAWTTLESAWRGIEQARGADVRSRRASLLATAGAIAAYHDSVVVASGLDRSTDLVGRRLAGTVAAHLPAVMHATFHLVDLSLAAVEPSSDAPLQAQRWLAERALADVRDDLDRLGTEAQWQGVADAGQQALAVTERLIARAGAATGTAADAAAIGAAVRDAVAAQTAFEVRLGEALDRLLQARIDGGRRAVGTIAACVLLLLAVGVYLLVGFHKVMAGGMRNLSNEVRRMAAGDLSARPRARGQDEVAGALQSLSGSLAMLSEMFITVRQGVAAVVQASSDIARGNGDLAERTELATRQLEQVVAGVHLYMEQLDQSARRVDEAARLVDAMRLDAARSRRNMSLLQARMDDLQGKSREIAAIVDLIDHIAFRTNVLALNASIEAAKAGESGRGFAVVAQEVRRLARRSAESARDIQDIVVRSTEDIVQGAALADRTGEALGATDRHVTRVHETMQQIVHLTRGGEANSRAILRSIHELDRLTDENKALVDQIAEASVALSGSGEELSRRVAGFKLG